MLHRLRQRAALFAGVVLVTAAVAWPNPAPAAPGAGVPAFTHVVEVMLENESATSTFENPASAPALAKLRQEGIYLPHFFGVGHSSLDNYEAAFAAVQPTPQGESDCLGQSYGSCIFPASVPTFGGLLDGAGRSWKIYSEGMAGAPNGGNCLHSPNRSLPDPYQGPGTDGYTTRHNPAAWFDSVLQDGGSEAYCQAHSVDLSQLWTDAGAPNTLPNWSFVEPDTCHDGHDTGCGGDPEGPAAPSGVAAIDAWLPGFVARLTTSPAWDAGSLLVITFDEGATSDSSGCASCHDGSAGGRVGALLIGAPVAHPGTMSDWSGDHYSLLRTWEAAWGLPTLRSQAATSAAAAAVHDGDPGVTPLTGIWAGAGGTVAACRPAALRIRIRRSGVTAAVAYLGRRRVARAHGRHVQRLVIRHPPARSFVVRIWLRRHGRGARLTVRVRLVGSGRACRLVARRV